MTEPLSLTPATPPTREQAREQARQDKLRSNTRAKEVRATPAAKPPPVVAAEWLPVINIIGGFANGKTEIIKRMLREAGSDGLMNSQEDPWVRFQWRDNPVSVFGPYRDGVGVGGLDIIFQCRTMRWICDQILREGKTGRVVFFEQMVSIGRDYITEIGAEFGEKFATICLNLPFQKVKENMLLRRSKRASASPTLGGIATDGGGQELTQKTISHMEKKTESVLRDIVRRRGDCHLGAHVECNRFQDAEAAIHNIVRAGRGWRGANRVRKN